VLLREMRCNLGQGYHFARPVGPAAITELLERQDLGEMAI
jgi:EAL domain-containing protein (putative c-di-GMP-specific phosphodiesterase class I)